MGRGGSAALVRRVYRRAGAWHDGTHDGENFDGERIVRTTSGAPVPDETVEALKFCREVHFSAKNDRGRDELEAALRGAFARLREPPSFRRWNARIPLLLSERYWA